MGLRFLGFAPHLWLLAALAVLLLHRMSAEAAEFPLGTHKHDHQTKDARVASQGWDPSYSAKHQADLDRWTAQVQTYPVGLPDGLQPEDLDNTGCPASATIDGPEDVAGLPKIRLSGVGEVPLIHNCNMQGKALKVWNGSWVAVYRSAFKKIDYTGGSTDGSRVFAVESLFNAPPNENAAILSGKTEINLMHVEVLGGNDGCKVMGGGLYMLGVHLHGLDREPNSKEHNDGCQFSDKGGPFIAISSNFQSAPRTSNAPLFGGTFTVLGDFWVADSICTGGTNCYKLGGKDGHYVKSPVFWNNVLMGDGKNVSWAAENQKSIPACHLGNSSGRFFGEGNTALGGIESGTESLLGRDWDLSSCNKRTIPQHIKDAINAKRAQLETWRDEIRAFDGSPPVPNPEPEPEPDPEPEPEPDPEPTPDPDPEPRCTTERVFWCDEEGACREYCVQLLGPVR